MQKQARQDVERNLSAVSVLTMDGATIAGFYTLSACAVQPADLPREIAKKLPRRPIPATLLERLAVNFKARGQGLGEILLLHALGRVLMSASDVASWAVVVDAKEGARAFYLAYTFRPLPSEPDRLYIPMQLVRELLPADRL